MSIILTEILSEDLESYLPSKWYHMVLAQREDLYIFNDDELIMILVEDCPVD